VIRQDDALPIWELPEAEFLNALRLKVFWKEMAESEAEKLIVEFENRKRNGFYYYPELERSQLLPCFHKLSKHTQELGCRTLDILHVSCATLIQADLFVSFDVKQCQLATVAGLKVVGPSVAD
jgi:hypothetical protein